MPVVVRPSTGVLAARKWLLRGGQNHIVFAFSFLLTEAPCMGLTVPDCLTDMAFLPQLPVYRKVNRQGLSCRVPEYCLYFHFIMNMENRIKIYCMLASIYLKQHTGMKKIENKCCL